MNNSIGNKPAVVDDAVIAICINEQFPFVNNDTELYDCTRCLWRINLARAQHAEYAFAVYQGKIREVYSIEEWHPGTPEERAYWINRFIQQNRTDQPQTNGRYGFTGHVAHDRIRNKYVGKVLLERFFGPIRYFNCPES